MDIIENKTKWLRSLKRGETKVGCLASSKECTTMSVLIYRWDIDEGASKGIRISASYDRRNCLVTITGNVIDSYMELRQKTRKGLPQTQMLVLSLSGVRKIPSLPYHFFYNFILLNES